MHHIKKIFLMAMAMTLFSVLSFSLSVPPVELESKQVDSTINSSSSTNNPSSSLPLEDNSEFENIALELVTNINANSNLNSANNISNSDSITKTKNNNIKKSNPSKTNKKQNTVKKTPQNLSENFQNYILDRVNALRNSVGVSNLTMDTNLASAASVRVSELPSSFSHTRPDGSSRSTAFPDYPKTAENISVIYNASSLSDSEMVDALLQQLIDSPAHYSAMVSSEYTVFGTAIYFDGTNCYIQQSFGNPAEEKTVITITQQPDNTTHTTEEIVVIPSPETQKPEAPAPVVPETPTPSLLDTVAPEDIIINYVTSGESNIMEVMVTNSAKYSSVARSSVINSYSAPEGYNLMFSFV